MYQLSFLVVGAFFLCNCNCLSTSTTVIPNGAASSCKQNLENCSAKYASGPLDCDSIRQLRDCTISTFSSCASTQDGQNMYYATLSSVESQLNACAAPVAYSKSASGPVAPSLTGAAVVLCLGSALLNLARE